MSRDQWSTKTRRAAEKYGIPACVRAYRMHVNGWGARGIALEGPATLHTTQQADAAINAGREMAARFNERHREWMLSADPIGRAGFLRAWHLPDTAPAVSGATFADLDRRIVEAVLRGADPALRQVRQPTGYQG